MSARLTTREFEVLEDRDVSTITNGLRVAAERFDEDAKMARDTAAALRAGQTFPMIAPGAMGARAMDGLAEQFEMQARDSRALIERLDDTVNVVLSTDEDMDWRTS